MSDERNWAPGVPPQTPSEQETAVAMLGALNNPAYGFNGYADNTDPEFIRAVATELGVSFSDAGARIESLKEWARICEVVQMAPSVAEEDRTDEGI